MAVKQLQIFGERCSGTNYVAQLLRRNVLGLRLTDRHGWKHGFLWQLEEPAAECLFVVVHRDPFDWVRSLHRQPWHASDALRDLPVGAFLRAEWSCEWGRDMQLPDGDERIGTEMMHEREPATGKRFANVLRMRTAKLRAWSELEERVQHCVHVRYEDVLGGEKQFVRMIARRYSLRRWPWHRSVRTFKGGAQRFVKKAYEPLPPADLAFVVDQLDADVERAIGYDIAARARELGAASDTV